MDLFAMPGNPWLSSKQTRDRYSSQYALGDVRVCPDCQQQQEWVKVADWLGTPVCAWSDCSCCAAYAARSQTLQDQSDQARYRGAAQTDLGPLARMAELPFDPSLLTPAPLYTRATAWLQTALLTGSCAAGYNQTPRPALYLYSPGPGVGKSHLAATLAGAAAAAGRVVCAIDELDYCEQYWAASAEQKRGIADLPARAAWLTVFDDIGSRQGRTAGVQDIWHRVIGDRWANLGWSIFTSNYTPDELLDQGTITDRTYSRIMHLCQKQVTLLGGSDLRMRGSTC